MIVHKDIRQEEMDRAFKFGLIIAEAAVGKHVKNKQDYAALSQAITVAGVEQIGMERMEGGGRPGFNIATGKLWEVADG